MISLNNLFSLSPGAYIVTGGLGFLGYQHCKAIAAAGGTPVAIDVSFDQEESLKNEIKNEYGIDLISINADITSKTSLLKAASEISNNYPIKGLINNAARNPKVEKSGLINKSRLEDFSLSEWNQDVNIGLTGSFLCTQVFGSIMNKSSGGSIVNISSDLGLIAPRQSLYLQEGLKREEQPVKPVTYSVIKSGLIGLTKYTATYWPENVRCNCLCPGGIENNQPPDFISKVSAEIPLGRLAEPEDIANASLFLCSEESKFITGVMLEVDGGRTI